MESVSADVLAFMHHHHPVEEHASFEPAPVTEARYAVLADVMVEAASEAPVVEGDARKTALVLASIAGLESGYTARVGECRVRGGTTAQPSWGYWQVTGRRGDVCLPALEQARLALVIVGTSVATCTREPLSLYTSGKCQSDAKGRYRWTRARDWWVRHEVAS